MTPEDRAQAVVRGYREASGHPVASLLASFIKDAIRDAVLEEREACAKLFDPEFDCEDELCSSCNPHRYRAERIRSRPAP